MPVRLELLDRIGVVTIDAPETRNALDRESAQELLDCLSEIGEDTSIRAAVIRGGGGTFCSGANRALLAEAAKNPYDEEVSIALETIYSSFVALCELPVPTIAALRGAAVGAGANLALAADVRIASDQARIVSGFLRIGLHPGGGHFTLLERLAGPQTTAAMTLLGQEVRGERLRELGLAWEVLPDEEVEDRAIALASLLSDARLARDAVSTFRAQSWARQVPMATAVRSEQAAQFASLARRPEAPQTTSD
ncbi:MAG: enoyl-CoA hydratase/isomerase family protein [Nocardioides sp.]|uniref:enoyl-CoA hydratase/isomerase family protein n=1 Tax=Nocardioides sp. TaxID=35761 RepID=UPI0039E44784